MSKTDKEVVESVVQALGEIVALSYITYSMGRFIKTDALLTAADFLQNSLEDRCPEDLKKKIRALGERKESSKDVQDWII